MKYRILGASGLRVSEIGFGCMSLNQDEDYNSRLLQQAVDKGINLFDTSDLYGKGANEMTVGKALKQKRREIILCTKVGNQWRPDGSGWDWNPRKAYILSAIEQSLRRLQTDYIDLYQLHGGTIEDPIEETIDAFEMLKQQGKIRFYGISSIRPNVIREYIQRAGIVSVMMQYSLLDRRPEETCFPLLQGNGVSVLARGSLAQGLLTGKPAARYLEYDVAEVEKAARAVQRLSTKSRTTGQTAIRFVLKEPVVASAVVGIRTFPQLEEAVGAIDSPALNEQEIQQLQQALPVNCYRQHR
ncbi:MAG TPA: aldo/keto reductase [Puia sp.]|nr:aldo/keto reductase [Puia sp.]